MQLANLEPKESGPRARIIDGDAKLFRENFNRATFPFEHFLADHPLYEIPRLLEVSKILPPSDVYYDAGDVRVGQRWDEVPRTKLSVDQLIERIENAGAWILLKRTNQLAGYGALYERLMADAAELVGARFPKKTTMRTAVILIASPNRITSYHMDPDCNFLCHIRGEKVLYVFDKYDRDVVPEVELERFWARDRNAAIYKERYQDRARSYDLKPGMGVHIPVNCPHWVKNSNNISVTLAASFQFPESELGNIYRFNYVMRKWGLAPTPPGRSIFRDTLKSLTATGAIAAQNALGRILGRKR